MNGADWTEIRDAFERALGLPAGERQAYLDETFEGRPDLRRAVDQMLAAEEKDDGFLEVPAGQELAAEPTAQHADGVGRRVGSFVLRRLLAAGGMGAVYEAEQEDPRRRVASESSCRRT